MIIFDSVKYVLMEVCVSFLGFTFTEVNSVRASASKVVCCHFSSDGKLLASGGHDKKVRTTMDNVDSMSCW